MKFVPYRPSLTGLFAERFYTEIQKITLKEISIDEINQKALAEAQWAVELHSINPQQRRIYRAVWLLFRDLVRFGWHFRWNDGILEIAPPIDNMYRELNEAKHTLRKALSSARLERIVDAKDFIRRMEEPPSELSIANVPITTLIADGKLLAEDMGKIASIPDKAERVKELKKKIKPYLQLVEENRRCPETGHKLGDIWRYFRFSWATPLESTPGRTMQYLIRDAARPYHPIMGIASLENSPLTIFARDNFLGWHYDAFINRLNRCTDISEIRSAFNELQDHISIGISEVNIEGLCSMGECQNPTDRIIQNLYGIAQKARGEREDALKVWQAKEQDEDFESEIAKSELGNISLDAEEALYRRKRATLLARLLEARKILSSILDQDSQEFMQNWKSFASSEAGGKAIRTALIALKNRHVGTSILELNVCGAIPPYNELLAGKLVALLMLSPTVLNDYRQRYGNRASDILSRMKGEEVIRPADLAFIGTTSLYKVGSSQYNRLKLPAKLFNDDSPEIRWQKLGITSGYGTLHISRLTLKCMEEVGIGDGVKDVNSIFGEGPSPKLRIMTKALSKMFSRRVNVSEETDFSKHAMSRIVYGALIASNGLDYLQGRTLQIVYPFEQDSNAPKETEKIIDYWTERWLDSRLKHEPAIQKIAGFSPELITISSELKGVLPEFIPIQAQSSDKNMHDSTTAGSLKDIREFVLKLYRGVSAYADNISPEYLSKIHVKTGLDTAVIDAVKMGYSVVLAGNPGDGKTHLLRMIEPELLKLASHKQPFIELDASSIKNAELKTRWESAVNDGRPFCAAINHAVLFSLSKDYPDFQPIQEACAQVTNSVLYDAEDVSPKSVIVFDLSKRNVLSKDIVESVLDKLTDENFLGRCGLCPSEGCDFVKNQRLAREQRFKERLQLILDRVSRKGYHATLRELQAFVSYLLFAGIDCHERLKASGDRKYSLPELCYSGIGSLFEQINQTFDPFRITHPIWDEKLIRAETLQQDWLPIWNYEIYALDPDNLETFRERKRAFYFFHEDGDHLLQIAGDDESEFKRFLEMPDRDALRFVIKLINNFFGEKDNPDQLRVWQSHRYNQSPRRILYSSEIRKRTEFEIVNPKLRGHMAEAFTLAQDHLLLRLKRDKQIKLKVDFILFELLVKAQRGVPVLSLETDSTRRLWQFIEQLSTEKTAESEVEILLFDIVYGENVRCFGERQTLDLSDGQRKPAR